MKNGFIALSGSILLLTFAGALPAFASGFDLGDAVNYAVLYEGTGGHNFQLSSYSSITGNVGIGGTGNVQLNGGIITGNLDFAGTGNCSTGPLCGGTVVGTITKNVADVTTAISTVNALSTSLGAKTGTDVAIDTSSADQTITVNPGVTCTLDGSGNCVFNVTSFNSSTGHTLTINGAGLGYNAVFNFGSSYGNGAVQLQSAIALTGGLTDSTVLWNITGGNTLQGPNNDPIVNGIFLDPLGTINLNTLTIDGQVFGGDSSDMQIVSQTYIDYVPPSPSSQPPPATPEPSSLVMFGTGLLGLAVFWFRRKRFA